jgi:hypothetical protein
MTKPALCAALRREDFAVQAAELAEATSPAAERIALEAAQNFVAGYIAAACEYLAASDENIRAIARLESLESAIVIRLAELSKAFHVETRERIATLSRENEPNRNGDAR